MMIMYIIWTMISESVGYYNTIKFKILLPRHSVKETNTPHLVYPLQWTRLHGLCVQKLCVSSVFKWHMHGLGVHCTVARILKMLY